jgi:hypothetical protein
VLEGGLTLEATARPLGRLYHQILIDGEPRAFAVSKDADGDFEVTQVMRSDVPRRIDEAITKIDDQFPAATRVRLIDFAPAHLYALWFASPQTEMTLVASALPGTGFDQGEMAAASTFLLRARSFLLQHKRLGLQPSSPDSALAQPQFPPVPA